MDTGELLHRELKKSDVEAIQKQIRSSSYVFSSLRLVVLPLDYPSDDFFQVLSIPIPEIPFKCVLVPELKGELVFSALSRLIVQRFKNDESFFLPNSFGLQKGVEDRKAFIAELRSFSPVERLITLDLTPSLESVFQKRLLHKLECMFSPDLLSKPDGVF